MRSYCSSESVIFLVPIVIGGSLPVVRGSNSPHLISAFLISLIILGLVVVQLLGLVPLRTAIGTSTAPIHRTFFLKGSFISPSGWNGTNPGPTFSAVSRDLVTIMLLSSDGFLHQWFIDFNNNGILDSNETATASPNFFSQTTYLNYTFTPIIGQNIPRAGNWTYRCSFHPSQMTGIIRILPEQVSSTVNTISTVDSSKVTTNGTLVADMRSLSLSGSLEASAVDSVSGASTFTKTYSISGLQLVTPQGSTASLRRFLLNVHVLPYNLSSDIVVTLQGLTLSASTTLTRQIDMLGHGNVDIFDASFLGAAWQTKIGSPNYQPTADLIPSDGAVDLLDVSVFGTFWQAVDFR
jgi:hypothetical protein